MKKVPSGMWFLLPLVILWVAYRIFAHSGALLTPTIITPTAQAHLLISPSLDARFARLSEELHDPHPHPTTRYIALTFDDGPYASMTPLLLDELRDLDVPATFFLIGRDVEEQPELTRRIAKLGFEIANHTRTHPNLDELSAREVEAELLGGSGILARFTTQRSARALFRPPHGRYTEQTIQIAQSLGYTTVLWNDDPGDWRKVSASTLSDHILAHAMSPEILLLHSGQLETIEMLDHVVPILRNAGYQFVTVSALLAIVPVDQINHAQRVHLTELEPTPTSTP